LRGPTSFRDFRNASKCFGKLRSTSRACEARARKAAKERGSAELYRRYHIAISVQAVHRDRLDDLARPNSMPSSSCAGSIRHASAICRHEGAGHRLGFISDLLELGQLSRLLRTCSPGADVGIFSTRHATMQQQERGAFREISGEQRIDARKNRFTSAIARMPTSRAPAATAFPRAIFRKQALNSLQAAARNDSFRAVMPGPAVAARPRLPHAAADGGGTEPGKVSGLSPRLDGAWSRHGGIRRPLSRSAARGSPGPADASRLGFSAATASCPIVSGGKCTAIRRPTWKSTAASA